MLSPTTSAPAIRPPAPGDFAALAANEAACHIHPWSRRLLADALGERHTVMLVAVAGGTVVGHVAARQVVDEGEVLNLCVAPEWRRRGWGRALLTAMLDRLGRRGAERVVLEVRASNTAAAGLYTALGFETLQVRRAYYPPAEPGGPRENARVMGRKLPLRGPAPGPRPDSGPTPPNSDRSP